MLYNPGVFWIIGLCSTLACCISSHSHAVTIRAGEAHLTLDLSAMSSVDNGLQLERFYGVPYDEAATLGRNEMVRPSGLPLPNTPTNTSDLLFPVNGSVESPHPPSGGIRYRPSTNLDFDIDDILGSWDTPTFDPFYVLDDGEQIGLDGVLRLNVSPEAGGGVFLLGDFAIRYAPTRATIPPNGTGLVITNNFDFPNAPLFDVANLVISATETTLTIEGDLLLAAEYVFFFGGEVARSVGHIRLEAWDSSPGDYNRDGNIDLADYGLWNTQYGRSEIVAGQGADGNRDRRVDAADFTVWQDHHWPPGDRTMAIPEPSSIAAYLPMAAFALLRHRRVVNHTPQHANQCDNLPRDTTSADAVS